MTTALDRQKPSGSSYPRRRGGISSTRLPPWCSSPPSWSLPRPGEAARDDQGDVPWSALALFALSLASLAAISLLYDFGDSYVSGLRFAVLIVPLVWRTVSKILEARDAFESEYDWFHTT